jgi:hypothetical protein
MNDTTKFFPGNNLLLVHHDNDADTLSRGSMKSIEHHHQQRSEKHFLMEEMNVRYNDEISLGSSMNTSKKCKSNNFETESQKRAAAKRFAKSYLAAKYAADKTLSRSKSLSTSDDDMADDVNAAATTTSITVLFTDSVDFEEGLEDPSSDEFSLKKKTHFLPRSARFDQPAADCNGADSDDDKSSVFSVSEMKQLVMDSLPPEIRDQVPPHAWDRIFRKEDDGSMVSDQSPLVRRLKHGSREDVSDLVSVISSIVSRRVSMASVQSDVSGITEAFSTVPPDPKRVVRRDAQHAQPKNMEKDPTVGPAKFEKVRSSVPNMISLSSSELSDAGKDRKTPRVAFGEVQVRNYPTILTINPAVTAGPAIGLGWTYDAKKDEAYTLDEYETARKGHRRHDDILLSRHDRETLLLELGYSQKDLADSIRKTIRVKNQRKQTVQNLNVSPVEEFLEKATRRVKRILKLPLSRSSSIKTDLVIPKAGSPPSSVSTAS